MDELQHFCCQNPDCAAYGQRGLGNLRVAFRYGPTQRRYLACRTCQHRFSERAGTALFDCRLPEAKALDVFAHLQEGVGIRKTSRLTGVTTNTVIRLALQAGRHSFHRHDDVVAFSPQTREVQLDEKWSFVIKKEQHCDRDNPDDDHCGDCWDHVALDAESRLILSVVPGRRSEENTLLLVRDVAARTGGTPLALFTSDENPAYAWALLEVYGEWMQPERQGTRGRHPNPVLVPPEDLTYATVHKTREHNRVVQVEARVVYGSAEAVQAALDESSVSDTVNTAYLERQNGTDRNRNARKVRKTYCFSKDWQVHKAVTYFTTYSYNFCWPVRTLRQKVGPKKYRQRTPAMAAGLADHVWSLREWLTYPAFERLKREENESNRRQD